MKRFNIAVIGAGIYGINHIHAFRWNVDSNLLAVCDLDEKRRNAVAAEFGLRAYATVAELLAAEDLDAVSIATPDQYHAEPALAAIEAGLHLFIEKPLATSAEDARAILSAAKAKGVRVAVDYHKRWDPAAIQIKNELAKPETGRPIRGYMSMDDVIDVPTKWFSWSAGSSPVHFLGTHCYDQIRWYMGCEVEEVFAVGSKTLLAERGIDTYDTVQAFLRMENGCWWTVENGWVYPSGFAKNNDGRTQILCENALLRADSQNRGLEIFGADKQRTPNSYFIQELQGRPFGFGIEPMHDFIRCLKTGASFVADGRDGLEAQKIAEAVHQSVETGERVTIVRESD